MKKKLLIALSIVGCGMVMFNAFNSAESRSRTQVPTGVSGGPGDIQGGFTNATCSKGSCHHDFAGSSTTSQYAFQYSVPKTGWVTSNVPASGYVPGQTYDITVSINSPGYQYGFQASCQTAAGLFKGKLIDNDSAFVSRALLTGATQEWISEMDSTDAIAHIPAISAKIGYRGTVYNANGKSWKFKWIAPAAGTGAVSFYAAMVTANGNGSDNGMITTTGVGSAPGPILGDSVFTSVLPLIENTSLGSIAITNECTAGSGAANMVATYGVGPYTYVWTPGGATTQSITGLAAGTYTCVVTDASATPIVKTFTGTVSKTIGITTTQATPVCIGGTGTMTATATGGNGVYTYAWAPAGGTTSPSAAVAVNTTYTVTVTDGTGCVNTSSLKKIDQGALDVFWRPWANINPKCAGAATGSLKVYKVAGIGTGGVFTYVWKNAGGVIASQTTATATGLTAGSYTCTVTAAAGTSACTGYTDSKAVSFTLVDPAPFTVSIATPTMVNCKGAATGAATATAIGGTAGVGFPIYLWNTNPSNQTTPTVSNLLAGSYTVTAQDGNNCVATANTTITEPTNAISGTMTSTPDNGTTNGSASIVATGGTGTLSYVWAPTGGTAANTTSTLASGTYSVTVTDTKACTYSNNIFVNTTVTGAGISITAADYTNLVGNNFQNTDTLPVAAIKPGNSGAAVTWNFTALHPYLNVSNNILTPTSTGTMYSSFTAPVPNMCLKQGTADYFYFDQQPAALNFLGYVGDLLQNGSTKAVVLSNPETVITYPSSYGTAFNDVSAYDVKHAYNGVVSGITVDSVREKETITISSVIDAYGSVLLPTYAYGFPCIRQYVIKTSVDSTWAKIIDPISTLHTWVNTSGTTSTTRSYSYITNVVGGPIVDIQMKANTTGNTNTDISEVKWNPLAGFTGISTFDNNSGITVYPNPASEYLIISNTSNDNLNLVIYDLTGREVLNSVINGQSKKISVSSLANGTYILKMFNKGEVVKTNNIVINN